MKEIISRLEDYREITQIYLYCLMVSKTYMSLES